MQLLKDDELLALVIGENPIVLHLPVLPADPFAKHSPIQPSSIDLRIGRIFLPETDAREAGGADRPIEGDNSHYILKVGGTAVITTSELLCLPGDIAAFGFPPTDISSRGVLMTNPGHVDPGFHGQLSFTVINMGVSSFPLCVGQPIVTLLFVRLSGVAASDYRARYGEPKPDIAPMLSHLSKDFVNMDVRAGSIAKDAVNKANWFAGGMLAFAGTSVLALSALISTIATSCLSVGDIQRDVDALKKQVGAKEQEGVEKLERRVESLESELRARGVGKVSP